MLSAFTSYLWGGDTEFVEEQPSLSVEEITEADGDWIMVQSLPIKSGKENAETDAGHKNQHLIVEDMNSDCSDYSNVGMEESWFVTPPPCFTGKKKRMREILEGNVSRLENLLIEHPSMSVYQPKTCTNKSQNDTTGKKSNAQKKQLTEKPKNSDSNAFEVAVKANLAPQVTKRLKTLSERQPFGEINGDQRRSPNRKAAKKTNLVNCRPAKCKRNKKQGLQAGKHVGMAGKRGT